jgi:NitT/TauT family transport system substrate-binding protein
MSRKDAIARPRSRSRYRRAGIAVAISLVTVLAGCGALGSSPGSGAEQQRPGPVEKPKIRIGHIPVVDAAPLYIAMEKGYFKEQGLEVELETVQSGPHAMTALMGGNVDVTFMTYPAAIAAQSKKVADIKILSDAYAARPGHLMMVAPKNSPVKRAEDVVGRKIAVAARGTISDLTIMSVLKTKGVDFTKINWVPMALTDMGPAMSRGDVEAAVVAEPWVTTTEKTIGAVPVFDAAQGPTAELSMSGWAATGKFTQANPNTVAAFQRAMIRAADEAQDRSKVEPVLVKYVKLDQNIAALVTLANFPRSLEATRIQRVSDLLREFDVIKEPFDVTPMLMNRPDNK